MPALTERNTLELYDAAKLDELYTNSESADSEQFAEMRSNLLLIAGDHYSKKGSKFYNRIRDTRALSKETSLKLTKNHIGNITNIILSKILSMSPNTTILPNNESEESDIKTAELNKSVWEYAKKNYKLRGKVREWAEDFVGLGECYAKLFWDTEIGSVIGYEQATDDEGELLFDENGEAIADETRPVMSGDFVFERVLAFNLLIDQEAQTIDDSPYFIVRKMVSQLKLKGMVDDDVFKAITKGEETTYLVFDGSNNGYSKDNKDILVRETYFRPCKQYPKGYFYISTREHRIFKGELPFGIWPFASAGYNKIQTSARCRSPVKQMRPYQIEINRTASAVATAQITLGSDKLVLSNGSKISSAGQLPGVRAISVTGGANPIILQGRGGEQYIPWLDKNITELYDMMNVFETSQVRDGKLDPYAMLFHSMKNKQKFQKYGETFEEFLVSITEIYLSLAKEYFEEDAIIPMVGRSERVNIAEFKHTEPNQFRITVEPIAADTETMLGKQLAINHTLQYVGNNIDKKE
nr:hypothetical protein [Bacteroidota bacterium]